MTVASRVQPRDPRPPVCKMPQNNSAHVFMHKEAADKPLYALRMTLERIKVVANNIAAEYIVLDEKKTVIIRAQKLVNLPQSKKTITLTSENLAGEDMRKRCKGYTILVGKNRQEMNEHIITAKPALKTDFPSFEELKVKRDSLTEKKKLIYITIMRGVAKAYFPPQNEPQLNSILSSLDLPVTLNEIGRAEEIKNITAKHLTTSVVVLAQVLKATEIFAEFSADFSNTHQQEYWTPSRLKTMAAIPV